jgi:hypothetical protein
MCGSSFKNKVYKLGCYCADICLVHWILKLWRLIWNTDAEILRHTDPKEPFSALAFKDYWWPIHVGRFWLSSTCL